MPGSDNQNTNWRFNSNVSLANADHLAEDVARLSIGSDQTSGPASQKSLPSAAPDRSAEAEGNAAHSRTSSSGLSRLPGSADSFDRRDQPAYPSINNGQRSNQKPQVNGRGRGTGFAGRNNPSYRVPQQIHVGLQGQGVMPSPGYPGTMSLGTPQQLYEMMASVDPAIARAQPAMLGRGQSQPNSADPAILEASGLANFGMFSPQLAGALSLYSNQYYPNQDAYRADLAAQAQAMLSARLQQQYGGQYPGSPPATSTTDGITSPNSATSSQQNGPSANNRKLGLYKTELCRSWEEKHICRYGAKCQFAHGEDELRNVQRHPKYKTEICRTFWVSGSCPYGKRCCFIHTELPHGANGAEAAGIASPADAHPRSQSGGSEAEVGAGSAQAAKSLLARISTGQAPSVNSNSPSGTPTPVDSASTSTSNFQFARPATGSLRVDTSSLDKQAYKTQNKSAFPVFPNAGGARSIQPAPEPITAKSPIPVTAGPDFGRHTASRMEIVGHNTRNGASTPTGGHSYSNSNDEGTSNHQRTSSNGAWRNNFGASPAAETINSPWTTQELVSGNSRQRPW